MIGADVGWRVICLQAQSKRKEAALWAASQGSGVTIGLVAGSWFF
jgi:hypothetical protein